MRLTLLLIACCAVAAETPKLPEPYQSIVELSHAAPTEFAADALLRLVESGKIADRDARRDLVEQAFRLAPGAKFAVRMRGVPGTTQDTRSGFLSQAYELKLDALSLQSRAVEDMLRIDPAKARKMFLEIPPPLLAPLTCDDALVYDLSDFYFALGAVVNGAFNQQERGKDEHLNFLLDYVGQVSSPAQVAPLAQAIQNAGLSKEQREAVWIRFNGMLQNLRSDDRSFSSLKFDPALGTSAEGDALLRSMESKTHGCKDDAVQARGSNDAKTPKLERYWQSAESKQILEDGRKLRFAPQGTLLTDADRSAPEWQQQLADYQSALAAWSASSEKSEGDYYNEKCLAYIALVELIPPGPQRDRTLGFFLDFVTSSGLQQQSPVEWYFQAKSMLERARSSNNGDPASVLDAFERSGNPVLSLEVALEKALGTRPQS
ncbi:MAG: hypothetical protein LAP38_03085 [Acidobacteriia bacterium]|nr:hypothetical protein [Terriglobia bacterium]